MTLLTPPPGDPRTPAEYTYDMERSGQMYAPPSLAEQFAEVFSNPTLTPEQIGERCAEIASAATPKRHELPAFEEWGQLSNGAEVWGSTDHTDPTGRCGVVHADVGSFRLTAQDEPNLIDIEGENVRIEGATLAQIHALRDLLNTTFPEQLLASAVAYGRGDAEPLTPPAAVVAERWVCDDEMDARCGQELGTEYRCGKSWIYFPDDGSRPGIRAFNTDIFNDQVDGHLDELIALLADPRVQALRRGETPGLARPHITEDGMPNKYDTGEYSTKWIDVRTPLGYLPNGALIEGLHDVDGSPHCAYFQTEDGYFYCGDEGVLAGGVKGEGFDDITLDQINALRRLLAGDSIERFMVIAAAWDAGLGKAA